MKFFESLFYDLPAEQRTIVNSFRLYFVNPSYRVMRTYRMAQYFSRTRIPFSSIVASRLRVKLINRRCCDIHFYSTIGTNFRLAHPIGVVIGAGVIIKNNVTIYQNVTLGSTGSSNKSYPTIENGCTIYAGAVIVGGVTIGENSIIGANSFVDTDIPANSVCYGTPLQVKTRIES